VDESTGFRCSVVVNSFFIKIGIEAGTSTAQMNASATTNYWPQGVWTQSLGGRWALSTWIVWQEDNILIHTKTNQETRKSICEIRFKKPVLDNTALD
jgi:hypothetical protein